jgi:lipopolysaccharide export system protein LptC
MTVRLEPLPTPAGHAESAWGRWLGNAWNTLSVYLPVVFMGALAMGSYWVVGQSPDSGGSAVPTPASVEPSYVMKQFVVRNFAPDGSLRTEIRGEMLRRYPQDGLIDMDEVAVRSRGDNGQWTTADANRLTTDDRQAQFTLRGQVVILRESVPRVEFRGEHMRIDTDTHRVTAAEPVVMRRGNDDIRADAMTVDEAAGQAILTGRVRATLPARP